MEKKQFYRVKLKENSLVNAKSVNGVKLTKRWLIQSGSSDKFKGFNDIDIQELKKEGSNFICIERSSPSEVEQSVVIETKEDLIIADNQNDPNINNNIQNWTEDQLKNYLISNGIDKKTVKTLTISELIEQVIAIYSQT